MNASSIQDLRAALDSMHPFVMCTVVETMGSSPGKEGQKMLVLDNETIYGTVGGGINEDRVRKEAVALLAKGGTRLLAFDLGNSPKQSEPICGGTMKVFLEVIQDQPRLVVFGGGHIGRVLTRLAKTAGFRVTLAEDRPEYAEACLLPDAEKIICCSYEESVAKAEIDSSVSVVIVTPGHAKDKEVLERVLKTPARYIGMIGSARKVAELKTAMISEGADPKRLAEVFSPIGINLGGDSPEEIAVGILAQMIAFRHGKMLLFEK